MPCRFLAAASLSLFCLAAPFDAHADVAKTKLDPKAIAAWSDEVFGKALAEHRISGLSITVTQDDKVLFLKGYGYQDVATKTPVAADKTQFRIASLTKTFVATGIVQMFERGEIKSLDDPANKYLKRFQFKQNGGQDITVWDLLTHRAGFGTPRQVTIDQSTLKPPIPGALLADYMPDYARPRDSVSVYCNYCWGMLGVMIEDVSGKTLADYLRDNIFKPLGMTNTALHVGGVPTADSVVQYAFVPKGPALALAYPGTTAMTPGAGAVISTAADMSKWLIANIAEGKGAGKAVLSPKNWQLMHTRHRDNHPDTNGFGAAFFIYDYNGEKVMEHYGSLQHRSMEFMLMDSKVGIFVTMAGGGEPGARANVVKAAPGAASATVLPEVSHSGVRALILDHFLGTLPFKNDPGFDVAKYVGRYRDIPRTPSPTQSPDEITVAASGDGGLVIGGRGVYRPSGNNVFTLDGPLDLNAGFMTANRYIFGTDAGGTVTSLYQHVNAGGYERIAN